MLWLKIFKPLLKKCDHKPCLSMTQDIWLFVPFVGGADTRVFLPLAMGVSRQCNLPVQKFEESKRITNLAT